MPVPKKNVRTYSKTSREIVYEGLNEWIMNGTMKPGEKIADTEVAEYFSVSRTPVREALQMLANQKLVIVRPGQGSYVAPLDPDILSQVYEMLAELHTAAIRLSFDRIDEKAISKMERHNDLYARAFQAQDNAKIAEEDNAFHSVYIDLAQNEFLKQFCGELNVHVKRFRNLCFWKYEQGKEEHLLIIEALRSGNMELAVESIRKNWKLSKGDLQSLMEQSV